MIRIKQAVKTIGAEGIFAAVAVFIRPCCYIGCMSNEHIDSIDN